MQHKSFRLNPVIKGISLVFCQKGVSYTHVSPCYISLCEKISCDKSWEIQITVLCSMNCCWLLISNFYHLIEIKISDLKECMTLILYIIFIVTESFKCLISADFTMYTCTSVTVLLALLSNGWWCFFVDDQWLFKYI